MHDLNNERAEEIRRIPIIYRDEKGNWRVFEEAVAISGTMIKHWHFAYMVNLGIQEKVKFCDYCKRLEAIRVPSGTNLTELELINACAAEDIHGFLRAKPPLRRESLARFSWMLPLFNEDVVETFGLPTPFRVLQHSRNVRQIPEKAPEEVRQAQMPYPRSYAGGIYGFVSTLDLDHIGYSFTDAKFINNEEQIITRRKIAVQAYVPMLTGAIGASLARALPVSDILETLVVTSDKPIPAPVHPVYVDHLNENVNLYKGVSETMKTSVRMYVWSKEKQVEESRREESKLQEKSEFELIIVKNPAEAFAKVIYELSHVGKSK